MHDLLGLLNRLAVFDLFYYPFLWHGEHTLTPWQLFAQLPNLSGCSSRCALSSCQSCEHMLVSVDRPPATQGAFQFGGGLPLFSAPDLQALGLGLSVWLWGRFMVSIPCQLCDTPTNVIISGISTKINGSTMSKETTLRGGDMA